MAVREISFPSANGRDTIIGWSYSPLGPPRAIVQIVHGFGEHSRRYWHMIGAFLDAGFVVYADDHIGHGKTGKDSGTLGDPHSIDYMTYVEDEHTLHDIAVDQYPDTPYFMFGHSWGSMIGRAYAVKYGSELAGLMLSGICSQLKGFDNQLNNPDFRAAMEADPYQPIGEWMGKLMTGVVDRYGPDANPSAWITKDCDVVQDYSEDPFVTGDVTLQLLWDMVQIYDYTGTIAWAESVPTNIPIYMIAGDQDPIGNYGEGLYHSANLLAETGHRVIARAYTGYRHEVFNEPEIRDEVEQGLVDFVNNVLENNL